MADTLEETLAKALAEADVPRRHGHTEQAKAIERIVQMVQESTAQYLDWLPEQDAILYTGRTVEWLRRHFKE